MKDEICKFVCCSINFNIFWQTKIDFCFTLLTLRCGFIDTEQLVDVDTDVHILSNELSMSNDAGLGLSEHGDSSREIESKSSSLNIVPVKYNSHNNFISKIKFNIYDSKNMKLTLAN